MKKADAIRVIIADDHPVYRNGVVSVLRTVPFIQKISQVPNGQELIHLLEQELHDIVLMDIRMSPIDGIQATEILQKNFPSVKVIALSSYDEERFVLAVMQKGASGYLLKNADRKVIIAALEAVMQGGIYYSKEIEHLMHQPNGHMPYPDCADDELKHVNPIYREIIFLVCHAYTNKEIGKILNRSKRTIDAYRSEILKLTKTPNSQGLHTYALRKGILKDEFLKLKFERFLRA